MNVNELLKAHRLLRYKLFRTPARHELSLGLEYEKNLYNSNPCLHTSNLLYDSVIIKGEDRTPILWGKFTIHSETELAELKSKLENHQLRVRNILTADYIRELGWKYPLHFTAHEKSKNYNIVIMPPEEDSTHRVIYLNGKLLKEQDRPSIMYTHDWHYIKMTPIEIEKGGRTLRPRKNNIIYKNLVGIHTPWLLYGRLKLTDMSWLTIRTLRKILTEENLPLSFKFQNFNIVVIPNNENRNHEVYVNGIEQRCINPFSKLHKEWFKATKDLTQEDINFRHAWRALLGLDLLTPFKPNLDNKFLSNYYQGVIVKNNLESYLDNIKEKYEKKSADPFMRAKHYIENFLARHR